MSWLWGTKDGTSDAVKKLDPSLRQFLEKEAPKSAPPPTPQPQTNYREAVFETAQPPQAATEDTDKPITPSKSLYPDGRYAHLWKTYKDPMAMEEQKTDQERLQDLVDSFNDRKKQMSRAALENCAFEHFDQHECFRSPPTLHDRFNMCHDYTKRLDRCFTMQGKFLRALGYAAMVNRNPEEEDRIQMHADRLFREMLEQEKMMQEAKERGETLPEMKPIMSKENISKVMGTWQTSATVPAEEMANPLAGLSEEKRVQFEKSLEGKSADERALLEREMEANIRTATLLREDAAAVLNDERKARQARREAGKETMGDIIKRWWGWQT